MDTRELHAQRQRDHLDVLIRRRLSADPRSMRRRIQLHGHHVQLQRDLQRVADRPGFRQGVHLVAVPGRWDACCAAVSGVA